MTGIEREIRDELARAIQDEYGLDAHQAPAREACDMLIEIGRAVAERHKLPLGLLGVLRILAQIGDEIVESTTGQRPI